MWPTRTGKVEPLPLAVVYQRAHFFFPGTIKILKTVFYYQWHNLESPGKRKTQGLPRSYWFVAISVTDRLDLITDVGWPSPLWVTPFLCRWFQVLLESLIVSQRASQKAVWFQLQFLLEFWLDFPQWWSVTWKHKPNKQSPEFLLINVFF